MAASTNLVIVIVIALIAGAAVGYSLGVNARVSATSTTTLIQTTTATSTVVSSYTQTVTETSAPSSTINGTLSLKVGSSSSVALVNGAWDGGYLWQVTSVANESVVQLVGNETYTASNTSGLVGGPADVQLFTFKAIAQGSTYVTLRLARPFQPNQPIEAYVLFVVASA